MSIQYEVHYIPDGLQYVADSIEDAREIDKSALEESIKSNSQIKMGCVLVVPVYHKDGKKFYLE